ncbi:MAG: TerB family tellurite resistance protein [Rhodothermales bacterium]|nr:TerB family tellurite resistance protein [Rhodothermales bacterium]
MNLNLVNDLALLYLHLAHGTDEDLTQEERHVAFNLLRQWLPNQDPALLDHVIREATLTYLGRSDRRDAIVERLGQRLDERLRKRVLKDLVALAQADGTIAEEERAVMQEVARTWEIDDDIVPDAS